MVIRSNVIGFWRSLAFTTLMAVSVFGTSTGAEEGIFSAGDESERFMGRWSRELAPLLVEFAVASSSCVAQSHFR